MTFKTDCGTCMTMRSSEYGVEEPHEAHGDLASVSTIERMLVGDGYLFHSDIDGFIHRVDDDLVAFVSEDPAGHGILMFEEVSA